MTGTLAQAEELVRQATQAGGVRKAPALRWFKLRQQAAGEDAEQIASLGEALLVAAEGPLQQAWTHGLINDGPEEAERRERAAAALQAGGRKDEAGEAAATEGEIDWGRVSREVNTMLELNRNARPVASEGDQE